MFRNLRPLIVPALSAAIALFAFNAIEPSKAAFWQWSKTSATNASVDPSINWAEGMSPSSVNDSARAMMARAAEYRDDISGLLTTAGGSVAYTVTTNQGLASVPNDGQMLAITMNATNGVAATLAADGGTVYPIQSSSGTAVGAATLLAGTPYTVKFSSSASAWILRDFYGAPFQVPIGAMVDYTGTTAPNSNFVLPYGQCISRTVYAAYFAMVSTTFGACDGTTTFAVPDMRGRVVAAADNMGGVVANRLTPSYFSAPYTMGGSGGADSHTLNVPEVPSLAVAGTISGGQVPILSLGVAGLGAGAFQIYALSGGSAVNLTVNPQTFTGGVTSGGGGAHAISQPTLILYKILRVL
jgi:microcystin-dependent protein